MTDSMKAFDNSKFKKEVLEAAKPTLVDFWAEWCGPCRMISPILDEISEEYKEKINLVKINIDDNHAIASEYGITSIPTIFVFDKGKAVKKIVGAVPKQTLLSELKEYLEG